MDDLETKKTSNMLRFKILFLQQGSKLSVMQHISVFTHITSLLINGKDSPSGLYRMNRPQEQTEWGAEWGGTCPINRKSKGDHSEGATSPSRKGDWGRVGYSAGPRTRVHSPQIKKWGENTLVNANYKMAMQFSFTVS